MDQILTSFLTAETVVFSIIIYLAVLALRRAFEWLAAKVVAYLGWVIPDSWERRIEHTWTTIILPVLPFAVGVVLVLVAGAYPFPAPFNASVQGKLGFGIVCAGMSGFLYRFGKEQLKKLVAKSDESSST